MADRKFTYKGAIEFSAWLDSPEVASGEMTINREILNPFGTVHAGALVWFADVVATTLAFGGKPVTGGAEGFPLAINLVTQLISNRREGVLSARAEFVKRGRRVSTVRTLVSDHDGRTLAELTSTHIASGDKSGG